MEHRWGQRLVTNIPVRLRCIQSRDTGCRCLGCVESISASGASIRTELGICPAPNVVVEMPPSVFAARGRELPASIVRVSPGEMTVEWREWLSTDVSAVLTETMLNSGSGKPAKPIRPPGRVPFCELAFAAAARPSSGMR
jgi:hypothetical protein